MTDSRATHSGAAGLDGLAPNAAGVRAVRGAITVDVDDPPAVYAATRELLAAMLDRNEIAHADLISAVFTVTGDLTSAFPAVAAREMGWEDVPLLCALEVPVPGALGRCVRVLLHATCARPRSAVEHVYLRGAVVLRPDLAGAAAIDRSAAVPAKGDNTAGADAARGDAAHGDVARGDAGGRDA